MKAGWFIGLLMMYVILTPVFGLVEQSFLPSGQMTVIGTILTPPWETFTTPLGIVTGGIYGLITWLQGVWNMLTFGYACFTGTWMYLRFLLCSVSGGIIISLILSLVGSKTSRN